MSAFSKTLCIIALFFIGFFVSLQTNAKKVLHDFKPYLYAIEHGTTREKYRAVQKIYKLRMYAQPFVEEMAFILYEAKDPLIKSFLLDTLAYCNYNNRKLYSFLNDEHGDVRASAINILVNSRDVSWRIYDLAMQDHDPFVRRTATSCLTRIGIDENLCTRALLKKCSDEDDEVRCIAIEALCEYTQRGEIAQQLKFVAMNDSGRARYVAIKALGHFPQSVPFIISFLRYSDTRSYALEGLAIASEFSKESALVVYRELNNSDYIAQIIMLNATPNHYLLQVFIKSINCAQLDNKVMKVLQCEKRYSLLYIKNLLKDARSVSPCLEYIQQKLQ